MRPYLPSPKFNTRPIRWPVQPNLQTQIQQFKGASQPSALSPVGLNQVTSANMPKPVQIVKATVTKSGTQRIVMVSFLRSPDPFFQKVNVYLRQGTQQPILVTASPTSPITFTLPKTNAVSVISVQTEGNWGPIPLSQSPTRAISLA
jgi:hypothetical protein